MTGVLATALATRQAQTRADLRRFYGVDLDAALDTMPAMVLGQYIAELPPHSATARAEMGDLADWDLIGSNLADLVDLMRFWLVAEYQKWITDPDDPEVKAREAERKRSKIKPPPTPIVPPTAARPPSVAAVYEREYLAAMARAGLSGPPAPAGPALVSSDTFDAALGI